MFIKGLKCLNKCLNLRRIFVTELHSYVVRENSQRSSIHFVKPSEKLVSLGLIRYKPEITSRNYDTESFEGFPQLGFLSIEEKFRAPFRHSWVTKFPVAVSGLPGQISTTKISRLNWSSQSR